MANRNDQVFPVSLSEIAFILIFVLMLLLGYMILQEREATRQAQALLAKAYQAQDAEGTLEALERAQQQLTDALAARGVTHPAEVIQAVVNAGETAADRDRLRQEVLDLTKKLVALEELRDRIEQAGKVNEEHVMREQIEDALALQKEVEKLVGEGTSKKQQESGTIRQSMEAHQALERIKHAIVATNELRTEAKRQLDLDVKPGQEPQVVRDVIEGARIAAATAFGKNSTAAITAENEKLKTQMAFYEKRDKQRGLDHPPCWMDKNSKIEYIFNVQTTPAGFVITRAWLDHRDSDARATQGFNVLMASPGSPMDAQQFSQGAAPYLEDGKKQSPECRHFVYLSSTIAEADRRDNARRLVNSFFYVLERRAPVSP